MTCKKLLEPLEIGIHLMARVGTMVAAILHLDLKVTI